MESDFMEMVNQLPDDELIILYELLCGLQYTPQSPAADPHEEMQP